MSRAKTTRVARSLRRRQKKIARQQRANEQATVFVSVLVEAARVIAEAGLNVATGKALDAISERMRPHLDQGAG